MKLMMAMVTEFHVDTVLFLDDFKSAQQHLKRFMFF